MKARHIISLSDVVIEPIQHELASSFGESSHKKLTVIVDINKHLINYEVKSQRQVIITTPDLEKAISVYNNQP